MEYKDYYAILGVNKNSTPEDIKHAYRRLARKYHPDVSKEANAEEKFKELQEAYEVLKDPEKKTAYDQLGSNWKAGQEFRPPPGWDSHTRFYNAEDMGDFEAGGFSDFFANLFGGRVNRQGTGQFSGFQHRGSDQTAKISITLEEAFKGATRMFDLQMPPTQAHPHSHANKRTIKVNIPAGVVTGQQLRLAKQGMPGMGGAPAGDLYLEVDILPHPLFSLKEHDIYLTLPVTPWEAALGAELKIPTLAGKVGLKLAPGSQTGQKLRLKGRGMPGATPGDQYAVVQIQTPPAHTKEQRELYENMAHVFPFNPRHHWSM